MITVGLFISAFVLGIFAFFGYKVANYLWNKKLDEGCKKIFEAEAEKVEIGSIWTKPFHGWKITDNPFSTTPTEDVKIIAKQKGKDDVWYVQYELVNKKGSAYIFSVELHNMFKERWTLKN